MRLSFHKPVVLSAVLLLAGAAFFVQAGIDRRSQANAAGGTVPYQASWDAARITTAQESPNKTVGTGVSQWNVKGSYTGLSSYKQTWTAGSSATPSVSYGQITGSCNLNYGTVNDGFTVVPNLFITTTARDPDTHKIITVFESDPSANGSILMPCQLNKGAEQLVWTYGQSYRVYDRGTQSVTDTPYDFCQVQDASSTNVYSWFMCNKATLQPASTVTLSRWGAYGNMTVFSSQNFDPSEWLVGVADSNVFSFSTVARGDTSVLTNTANQPNFAYGNGAVKCGTFNANCFYSSGQYGATFSESMNLSIAGSQVDAGGFLMPLVWNVSGIVCDTSTDPACM